MNIKAIDIDELVPGCQFIKWREVLHLPRWGIYCFPLNDQHHANLIGICQKLELCRAILGGEPLTITSGYRPAMYNTLIGGANQSEHMEGNAIDFQHKSKTPDQCKAILCNHLENLKIRMEKDSRPRVHIDTKPPGKGGRYFVP